MAQKEIDIMATVTFKNATEIDAYFMKIVKQDFVNWFNSTQANIQSFGGKEARKITNPGKWREVWNNIGSIVYTKNGGSFNLLEFFGLNTIIINETGGSFVPLTEGVNKVSNPNKPGIAYAFNSGGKKSYNTLPGNLNAYQLFRDANYIAAHVALPYGTQLQNTLDTRWQQETFPTDDFTNLTDAVRSTPPTFLTEADFFKFRGRGLIQTTGRANYTNIIKFVIEYTGANAKILSYKNRWNAAPFNSQTGVIATRSTNADWDDLFLNTSSIIPLKAVEIHATTSGAYQYIPLTTEDEVTAKYKRIALKVSGSAGAYNTLYQNRIKQQFDELQPSIV